MAKIAIVDGPINTRYIKENLMPPNYVIRDGRVMRLSEPIKQYTHATVCAQILEKCTSNYSVVSIQIIEAEGGTANIENLVKALELCYMLNVEIINMSIGTTQLFDSLKLNKIIYKLFHKRIIMTAALHNAEYASLPAMYPCVIGVRSDKNNFVKPGEIFYDPSDYLKIQITANCNFRPDFYGIGYSPSNSFAAPVATAYINQYINQGVKTHKDIINCLKQSSKLKKTDEFLNMKTKEMNQLIFQRNQVPCILVYNKGKAEKKLFIDVMNSFYIDHQIEAVGITNDSLIKDVRCFQFDFFKLPFKECLSYIEQHTKADVIVSLFENEDIDWDCSEIDMSVSREETDICLRTEKDFMRISLDGGMNSITKQMIQILK